MIGDAWIVPSGSRGCQGRRRLVAAVAVLMVAPFLTSCAARSAVAATVPARDEQRGTIRQVGTLGLAIVPDANPGARYVPERPFPADFAVDGLRVIFSGSETAAPEGVRAWGTPFRLATLRRAP